MNSRKSKDFGEKVCRATADSSRELHQDIGKNIVATSNGDFSSEDNQNVFDVEHPGMPPKLPPVIFGGDSLSKSFRAEFIFGKTAASNCLDSEIVSRFSRYLRLDLSRDEKWSVGNYVLAGQNKVRRVKTPELFRNR